MPRRIEEVKFYFLLNYCQILIPCPVFNNDRCMTHSQLMTLMVRLRQSDGRTTVACQDNLPDKQRCQRPMFPNLHNYTVFLFFSQTNFMHQLYQLRFPPYSQMSYMKFVMSVTMFGDIQWPVHSPPYLGSDVVVTALSPFQFPFSYMTRLSNTAGQFRLWYIQPGLATGFPVSAFPRPLTWVTSAYGKAKKTLRGWSLLGVWSTYSLGSCSFLIIISKNKKWSQYSHKNSIKCIHDKFTDNNIGKNNKKWTTITNRGK